MKKLIDKIKYELRFQNTNYRVRISQKISKTWYRYLLKRKIKTLQLAAITPSEPNITLAILAGKKNFYESIAALCSFYFWENNLNIHYHEDGSLNEKEIAILKKKIPGIVIFRRNEEQIKICNELKTNNLFKCAELRSYFLFSIRLFDMIAECQTPYLLQIDSDVLFFSRPNEILETAAQGHLNGCYNQDNNPHPYTFSAEILEKHMKKNMIGYFNAGVFMHRLDKDFFRFAETIMEKEPWAGESWHLEQTLFAMYASEQGGFLPLPRYYDLAQWQKLKGESIVSEHYTQGTGFDFHKDFIYRLYPMYKDKQLAQ